MKAQLSFLLSIMLLATSALAEPSGRELLDKARDFTASAPVVRRVDTVETSITGPNLPKPVTQKNVVTIEINMSRQLARQTGTEQGKQLVMLRQGSRSAMKLGDGPWEVPAGPYARVAADMGNLFVCEVEVPENNSNAPEWKVTGTEPLGGHEAIVVETGGDSAVRLAQERMTHGIARTITDPAERPEIKVLSYASKHWIDKVNFSHIQAVQSAKFQLTLPGSKVQLTQEMNTTSDYSYNDVNIDIPEAAQRILAGKSSSDSEGKSGQAQPTKKPAQ